MSLISWLELYPPSVVIMSLIELSLYMACMSASLFSFGPALCPCLSRTFGASLTLYPFDSRLWIALANLRGNQAGNGDDGLMIPIVSPLLSLAGRIVIFSYGRDRLNATSNLLGSD